MPEPYMPMWARAVRAMMKKPDPKIAEYIEYHTRAPYSQFTKAEIETPGGTITPQRTRIDPLNMVLPGITEHQMLRGIDKYIKARARKFWKPLLKDASTRADVASELFEESEIMKEVMRQTPKRFLDSLGKFVTKTSDPAYAGEYQRAFKNIIPKSSIGLNPMAHNFPPETFAHELLGHHIFDRGFRQSGWGKKARSLAEASDDVMSQVIPYQADIKRYSNIQGIGPSARLVLKKAREHLSNALPEEAFAREMARAGHIAGPPKRESYSRLIKPATEATWEKVFTSPGDIKEAYEGLEFVRGHIESIPELRRQLYPGKVAKPLYFLMPAEIKKKE